MAEPVFDTNGNLLEVGSRVWCEDATQIYHGTITKITDPDGDVDDEGRSYGINPYVFVLFDNEDEPEQFSTSNSTRGYMDDPMFVCDDVDLVIQPA